jgi:transposase-like protein
VAANLGAVGHGDDQAAQPVLLVRFLPEAIGLVAMMYVRYPLSLRNVEDLLFERGIDICHETVCRWWGRFGPMFADEIRLKRVQLMRPITHWKWRLEEVYVKINGEMRYLWRAMVRFRRMKTLQKFAAVHSQLHNHFNQERHLVSRRIYKERRAVALAAWQSVMG